MRGPQEPEAAVTIDLDGVRHYHAIHGLPPPRGIDPILTVGVRRFLDVCARLALRATVFVVTRDAEGEQGAAFADVLRQMHRAGHELGSHSHAHAYDLPRRSPAEIQSDLLRSADTLEAVVGRRPRGFRAPGYNLSEPLLDALELAGFTYDSSVMPAATYFAARAAAIAAHRLAGRRSSSLPGDPRAFLGDGFPYRPRRGAHHRRARARMEGRDLVEIPIAALPLGLPWLGTTLALAPLPIGVGATALAAARARRAPLVLELHAIDFCSATDGFDARLARLQPDLRVPLRARLHRLEATLRVIAQTRAVLPLEEIVAGLDPASLVGRAPADA